ncbi:gamma-glutamyl-gamma-aminobutyrate hydrolase family protein [Granulicella sp. WH15]|uniref:gamma-glutamyl-gamma-aminobutyrate hydrolase family protein n=1 Tax=Granulicella sp. WH15 TaxID=2602070 RepID=UPI0013672B5C|nr:gamma-glutamyl-gamma-aminobutyrate hydrolase family protein [Granulicella sp. WH15]QHN05238.1 gamma-glutamyl-gamma-aminobutyrate hydrolase family protein [Granulicella sp. WH15]
MSIKPRIAIPVPTSFNHDYNQRSWPQYAAAVERSGGEPVKFALDLTPRAIADLANSCQGVLLPGSPADVNPQKYGQEPIEATAAADLPRENVDELLLQDAHNLYKPILTICFGTQMLNVWRSGTLVQDLTVMPVNHAASKVAVAHSAAVLPESLLGHILTAESASRAEAPEQDSFLRLPINSSHHQAVGIPGDGLKVVARCPQDAVVEAIEGGQGSGSAHFVLGLQWHPERSYDISPSSKAIFDRFVESARLWAPRPIHTSVA